MSCQRPPHTRYPCTGPCILELHSLGKAIVRDDVRTGDQTRGRTCDEDDDARDFLDRSHAPARDLLQGPIIELGLCALDHLPGAALEIDGPGRDRVDPDVLLADKLRELLAIGDQASLD